MRTLLLLIILFLPAAAYAKKAEPYFPADTISPTLLTRPLEVKGEAWNAEIDQIIALQKAGTPEAIKAAEAERNLKPEMVAAAVAPELTREKAPAVYVLLDRAASTAHGITDTAKDFWHTRRPYLMDTRVKALIDAHDNPAYPSGHTSGSYTQAHVLCLLVPDKCVAFIARAEEIAQHRALVGMHYPHDLAGGRQLALLIVGALLQTIEFREDLAAAKQELEE